MSLDMHVFINSLPDCSRWQAAIDLAGIELILDPKLDLATASGFSPCQLKGRASGFEILVAQAVDLLGNYPSVASAVGSRSKVICLTWGGDLAECACVLGASLALRRSFDAVVYYPADDIVYDESSLRQELQLCLAKI